MARLAREPFAPFHLIWHIDQVAVGDRHGTAVSSLDKPRLCQCFEISPDGRDVDAEAEGKLSRLDVARLLDQLADVAPSPLTQHLVGSPPSPAAPSQA